MRIRFPVAITTSLKLILVRAIFHILIFHNYLKMISIIIFTNFNHLTLGDNSLRNG